MRKHYAFMLFILSAFLYSCNMEKEIDLKLPEYTSKMVVECYLEPGKPYQLSLLQSETYFAAPGLPPTIDSAFVTITHNGIVDSLKFDPVLDPFTNKFHNYRSLNIVPADYDSEFTLYIEDRRGRIVTGKTKILKPVKIDTVEFIFNEDSMAYAITKFTDNSSTSNYYRYMVLRVPYPPTATPEVEAPVTSFTIEDAFFETSSIVLGHGSRYQLENIDSVTVALYHISEDYFDFLESVGAARDANGNPFGQPASIRSNVVGALGIFTGLAYDRKELKVK